MEGRAEKEESYICPPQPRPVKDPRHQASERPLIATHAPIPGTRPSHRSYSAPASPAPAPPATPRDPQYGPQRRSLIEHPSMHVLKTWCCTIPEHPVQ